MFNLGYIPISCKANSAYFSDSFITTQCTDYKRNWYRFWVKKEYQTEYIK